MYSKAVPRPADSRRGRGLLKQDGLPAFERDLGQPEQALEQKLAIDVDKALERVAGAKAAGASHGFLPFAGEFQGRETLHLDDDRGELL